MSRGSETPARGAGAGPGLRPAVFLDRDGTIIEEIGYLHHPADVRLIAAAADAIRRLNQADLFVAVATNQAGVGRGYFALADVERVNAEVARQLAAHGARLDAMYLCPHHPDERCECRKPGPGMLRAAAEEHRLDLGRSWMVGDKLSDLLAGAAAGTRTALVMTGYGERELERARDRAFTPSHVAADVNAAVDEILVSLRISGRR